MSIGIKEKQVGSAADILVLDTTADATVSKSLACYPVNDQI